MQINIQEKKHNIFLKRVEVKGKVTFEAATPSNVQLAEVLAKEMQVKEASLVVIKHLYTTFSHRDAKFEALVYDTADAKNHTEKLTSQQRKKLAEAKAAAAASAESK